MGSFSHDKWYQCHWCGWWGYFGPDVPDYRLLLPIDIDGWDENTVFCAWCSKKLEENPKGDNGAATHEDKGAATATASDTTTKTESDTKHTVAANHCLQKTHETEETIEHTTAEEMIGG